MRVSQKFVVSGKSEGCFFSINLVRLYVIGGFFSNTMAKFVIEGGQPLHGAIEPIGNKNAVLKMMAATLLTAEPVTLTNVPAISDVLVMARIMEKLGTKVSYDESKGTIRLQTSKLKTTEIDPTDARQLRASNVFLGPLLVRAGQVSSVMPGGDKIGPREMNAHFDGLSQLGAVVQVKASGSFNLQGKLRGATVFLYEPSVTATENVLLAAVLAPGTTVIDNAAAEPHVRELCTMLVSMGAKIEGAGTNQLRIVGVKKLRGTTYRVPVDFIYVGTMAALAVMTKGSLTIKNVDVADLRPLQYFFAKLGVTLTIKGRDLLVPKKQARVVNDPAWARTKGIYSQPWPCFPTDLMSLMIVLATQVSGSVLFFEKMYPARMAFAEYLNGMGANIFTADSHRIVVNGPTELVARRLVAPDLRAGMAYVAAALVAHGRSTIENIEHIDRGYPHIETTLAALGARIKRIAD